VDSAAQRRERRREMTIAVRALHDHDASADAAFWKSVSAADKFAMVWGMALEYHAWRHPGVPIPPLDRSVCRVIRGGASD
jgi:hypothetical protein